MLPPILGHLRKLINHEMYRNVGYRVTPLSDKPNEDHPSKRDLMTADLARPSHSLSHATARIMAAGNSTSNDLAAAWRCPQLRSDSAVKQNHANSYETSILIIFFGLEVQIGAYGNKDHEVLGGWKTAIVTCGSPLSFLRTMATTPVAVLGGPWGSMDTPRRPCCAPCSDR